MKETVSYRDLALTAYGRMKQFVEFFGKFYEGGGKKFSPFKENTKYYKVKEEI